MDTAIAMDEPVGAAIDRLMLEKGFKAFFVAAAIGTSYGTFRAIRTGRRPLKDTEAAALARLFDVPVTTFLRGETDGQSA